MVSPPAASCPVLLELGFTVGLWARGGGRRGCDPDSQGWEPFAAWPPALEAPCSHCYSSGDIWAPKHQSLSLFSREEPEAQRGTAMFLWSHSRSGVELAA